MALSANQPIEYELGDYSAYPVEASTRIFDGAMITLDGTSRNATPLNKADAALFAGHADREADNSSGAAGAIFVKARSGRYKAVVTLASVAVTDQGKSVYAVDDATLSLTATNNLYVGVVDRYISANKCLVEFRPFEMDVQAALDLKADA